MFTELLLSSSHRFFAFLCVVIETIDCFIPLRKEESLSPWCVYVCALLHAWFVVSRYLILSLLSSGKPFAYMPYDLKLIEQESHGAAVRPGSPYRLSPREPSKASPQSDGSNPIRYSVPPGKQLSHVHWPVFTCKPANLQWQSSYFLMLCLTALLYFSL